MIDSAIAGVALIAAISLIAFWVGGRYHARHAAARNRHPTARPAAAQGQAATAGAGKGGSAARRSATSTLPELPPAVAAGTDDAMQPGFEVSHTSLRELIDAARALPDRDAGEEAEQPALDTGSARLSELLTSLLASMGYAVDRHGTDLIATRGDERMLVRVVPWDGKFGEVGERTLERFASEVAMADLAAAFCISEAEMPATATALECEDDRLCFAGRSQVMRMLDLIGRPHSDN